MAAIFQKAEDRVSFANEFKRARRGIDEEIAYYRRFADLDGPDNDGMSQGIKTLEELRDNWDELTARFAGRGRMPSRPFDWEDDDRTRVAARESMNKMIKAAAAAEEGPQSATSGRVPASASPEPPRAIQNDEPS